MFFCAASEFIASYIFRPWLHSHLPSPSFPSSWWWGIRHPGTVSIPLFPYNHRSAVPEAAESRVSLRAREAEALAAQRADLVAQLQKQARGGDFIFEGATKELCWGF